METGIAPPLPAPPELQSLDVRGLRTAYRCAGAGPPLVHLHGEALSRHWLPFYEELTRSVELFVPQHPGFGETALPEWLDGFDDLVLHYGDLLDALNLPSVHLSGHSLGAWIAAEIAVFMPGRVRSLSLICPVGLSGGYLIDPFREEPEEMWDLVLNGRSAQYPEYTTDEDPIDGLVRRYGESVAHARLAWNPRHDAKLERRLARVRCPALILVPDEDRFASVEQMQRFADFLPEASVRTISNEAHPTGHLVPVQEPVQTAEAVARFVRRAITSA